MTHELPWLDLLVESCRIDSTTIAGAKGATQVAQRYGDLLEAMGFELAWHDTDPTEPSHGKHLQAVRCSDGPHGLLLIGHTDTVLTPQASPIRVDQQAQHIYGSGTGDMKGGNILMLHALQDSLAQSSVPSAELGKLRIEVLFNTTEEIAGPSFRRLARDAAAKSKLALVFEAGRQGPEEGQYFVTSRKGICDFALTCHGRAAHSGGEHDYGISAIHELARKIDAIAQLTDDQKELTANIGMIQGGQAVNQVADIAQAKFELRAYDPTILEEARKAVRAICSEPTVQSRRDGAKGTLTLKEYMAYPPWPASEKTAELATQYQQIAQTHGLLCKPLRSGGGSDACHVADLLPVIDGLGIYGGGAHQPTEWADLATFPARSHTVRDLMIQCARQLVNQAKK